MDSNLTQFMENQMSRKKIGYVRVSTYDQNPDLQLENIKVDKIFTDKRFRKRKTSTTVKRSIRFC